MPSSPDEEHPAAEVDGGQPLPTSTGTSDPRVVLDLGGRWVWRGNGARHAHLIRERSTTSTNPWTVCGKRVRNPRETWQGLCPSCRNAASRIDAEATPPARRTP
jgi:hypothetical protein